MGASGKFVTVFRDFFFVDCEGERLENQLSHECLQKRAQKAREGCKNKNEEFDEPQREQEETE